MKIEFIEEVKRRLDLRDVISVYVPQIRGRLSCDCPFCDDINQQFIVNRKTNTFKCLNCKTRGDVFTFLQNKLNITIIGAIDKAIELVHVTYFLEIPDTVREIALEGGWIGR